jgi:phospholipid/cholesterol/gamma-HCH transport system ATP-binding protein
MADGNAVSAAVVFDDVSFAFDEHVVLRHISFGVRKGSLSIVLGASGTGKSVVLKLILRLLQPDASRILVNGQRIDTMTERDRMRLRADIGMLFQESALFDSLTVAENVGYRLYEETDMPFDQVRRRVEEVLASVGLAEYIDRMPSELSGGQRRRVAIARAIAAKPFGLDPGRLYLCCERCGRETPGWMSNSRSQRSGDQRVRQSGTEQVLKVRLLQKLRFLSRP